jgi:hypothetical protein
MESQRAERALVEATRRLSPEERLEAFLALGVVMWGECSASVTDADICVRIRRDKHHGDAHALRPAEGIPLSVRSRGKVIS